MTVRWRLSAHFVLSAMLAACGGGGGGGAETPAPPPPAPPPPPTKLVLATAADNLLPTHANGISVFASSAGPESVVLRVSGTQTVDNGMIGTVIRRSVAGASGELTRIYLPSSAGLRQYVPSGADALERAFDATDVMRFPAHAGDSFLQLETTVDSGQDFDGDGRADRVTLHAEVSVVGLESVSTPAGHFNNALRQKHVLTQTTVPSSGSAPAKLTTTTDTWYVAHVGAVKSVVQQQGNSLNTTTTETLAQFRTGTMLGGIVAPAVQSTAPSSPAGASAVVNAVFNVDMEESSFAGNTFSVTDSGNRSVAGSVRVKGKSASFFPEQPLASGNYTGRISLAAKDLFGNPLAASREWAFQIDATAPSVLSTWPKASAINVALTTTISITLSKTPAIGSVKADNVKLSENGVSVPATLGVNGNSIWIEPTGGLAPGRRYSVQVSGISDLAGNVMSESLHFDFDTTPQRFANPEWLGLSDGSIAALAVATGDVNGDGIPDVLFTDWGANGSYPMALYVRTGKPDGQLNAPVIVDVGPLIGDQTMGYCALSALAVGDVTGDGRADVVLGARTCGVLVLRQNSAGSLEVGQFITTPMHTLRVADVNLDGRLDVVGVHNYLALAVVWQQQPDGQLVLGQTPSLGNYGGRDVDIGDINGDGRPDLVVSLFNAQVGPNIALLRQQADGGFAAPDYLSTGALSGAAGVALGDLNGDGRLDIVASAPNNAPAWLTLFLQSADGGFAEATRLSTLDNPWAVRVADIDNNGRADIVVTHTGWSNVGIYLQGPDGILASEELYEAQTSSVQIQVLAISDLNRDGLRDIVVSNSILRQQPLSGRGPLGAEARSATRFRR